MLSKSLITNLLALLLIALGWFLPAAWQLPVMMTGLFALAGAVTNWLAVHMLFERVPGLYGSGVIMLKFAAFRQAIADLLMQQFFSEAHLSRFSRTLQLDPQTIDFKKIIEHADLTPAWDSLTETIKASSFGGMLTMFGGEQALAPLKQPFIDKMQLAFIDIAQSDAVQQAVHDQLAYATQAPALKQQVAHIVDARLAELTPDMVKDIIKKMIHAHLGWLVVWGGFFGGIIGLISSFMI
ncbi:hypothetical protein Q7C_19 [Methylophaga frappieri]|uniref:DUF445 domain-containing protein n=2 Tax=Methylophaga frappieri (strain ATCC BAA-2434 / DSM 25690 / JAM7) TaxID=754477 RepID=I1YE61_METFJ|nr:hypothetical protein Q7C_19 [Methylophaga frappieri]